MILPNKHVSTKNSLLGVGATVIEHLNYPCTVTALWDKVSKAPDMETFERFVLVLDLLYTIGAIDLDKGLIYKRQI